MSELRTQSKSSTEPMRSGEPSSLHWPARGPLGLFREFTNEMERGFRGLSHQTDSENWAPTVDVQQCGGNLVVSAELPGLKRDEVKVELNDNTLIIEGERKREHRDDHEGYHRFERSYGHFYRAIPLPEGANTEQVKAELKDGVLKVSLPVAESKKNLREVPIEEVKAM